MTLEFKLDYFEMKQAALKMAKESIDAFDGDIDDAVDYHATQGRIHLEILTALCEILKREVA